MAEGWKCPKCGGIYAPHVTECYRCNRASTTTTEAHPIPGTTYIPAPLIPPGPTTGFAGNYGPPPGPTTSMGSIAEYAAALDALHKSRGIEVNEFGHVLDADGFPAHLPRVLS